MLRYNKWMRAVGIFSTIAVLGFALGLFGSVEANANAIQETTSITANVESTALLACPWDLNGDGRVNDDDLNILIFCWSSPCCGNCCDADFDSDGNVATSDLLDLLAHYGTCP